MLTKIKSSKKDLLGFKARLKYILLIWLTGFSGADGPEGHAAVSEHLWGALFPQSGPDGLGLYIQPYRHAQIWVTVNRFVLPLSLPARKDEANYQNGTFKTQSEQPTWKNFNKLYGTHILSKTLHE